MVLKFLSDLSWSTILQLFIIPTIIDIILGKKSEEMANCQILNQGKKNSNRSSTQKLINSICNKSYLTLQQSYVVLFNLLTSMLQFRFLAYKSTLPLSLPHSFFIPKRPLYCLIALALLFMAFVIIYCSPNIDKIPSSSLLKRQLLQDPALASKMKQFDKYFASKAQIIEATKQLRTDYKPIEWPEFNNTLPAVEMSVLFTASLRKNYESLQKTLTSFFAFNTYPIVKVVAVNDGPLTEQLSNIISLFPNITWIITNVKVGQLEAIDQALKHVNTQYYFSSEDDFQYIRSGFIQYSLQALLYDSRLNGLSMGHSGYDVDYFLAVGPLLIITPEISYQYSGLSFWPSTRRMKSYLELEVGYNQATFNISYAKGAGICQPILSMIYTMKGYHYGRSYIDFYVHLRPITNQNKVLNSEASKNPNYTQILVEYNLWVKNRQASKAGKGQLDYLIPKVKYSELQKNIANEDLSVSKKKDDIKISEDEKIQDIEAGKADISLENLRNNKQADEKRLISEKQDQITETIQQIKIFSVLSFGLGVISLSLLLGLSCYSKRNTPVSNKYESIQAQTGGEKKETKL